MDTSIDATKKGTFEDLPKEELITKYRGLLNILQKAKQSKSLLIEENNNLKRKLETQAGTDAAEEILEKLTQQKLELVTSLEDVKNQKDILHAKLRDCELNLNKAESKIVELDTENQVCQRQVSRLTEENEQLLTDLDSLEKQTEELKKIGLTQQQQLLELEKNNDATKNIEEKLEIIEVLNVELDKVKKNNEILKKDNDQLKEKNCELMNKMNELNRSVEIQDGNYKHAEILINDLKVTIQEKNKQNENYLNTADDLNIELHKNKALVEKLKQDIVTMSNKLSDNQIISSGVASDLQNTNEKLKDKLKSYHSKIIKFAGDVKILKQQKSAVFEDFKNYMHQVKLWEEQLKIFSTGVLAQFKEIEKEKLHLKTENESYKRQIENCTFDSNQIDKLSLDNKCLEEKVNKYKEEIEKLMQKMESLSSERVSFLEQSDALTSELKIIRDEQEKEKSYLDELRYENQILTQKQNELNTELLDKNKEFDLLRQQISEHQHLIEDYKAKVQEHENISVENKDLNVKLLEFRNKSKDNVMQITDLNSKVYNLQEELNLLKTTEVKLAEQSANEIRKLVEQNKVLSERNVILEQMNDEIRISTNDCGSQASETDDQLCKIKRENAELLSEMNEMNQVLKERGETISKQQEYCEELMRNVKVYESQASKLTDMVRQKEEIISKLECDINSLKNQSSQNSTSFNEMHGTIVKKDEEINQLRNELLVLKEKLNTSSSFDTSQDVNYAESETMSTSTISRTEEVNRLKDLEGSWEERYGKLRSLALKLKGKIRDLTNELTKEQTEKADVQQKLASSIKTTQTLQLQCDKLQDELEQGKKDLKGLSKKLDAAALDVSNTKKQLADNDETIAKLKAEIEGMNKEKINTDSWKKQVSSKVQNLKKELEANNVMKKDFENQISKLNAQLEARNKQLTDEIEKHNTTKNSLQESHNECKKQSVLNLEMQDYERSLKDLTQKLDKKQELITKLKNQLDSQKSTMNSIKEQNRLLEERVQNEESDLSSARNEVQAYKKSLSDLESVMIQKDDEIQNLTRALENSRTENEDLSTQLSKIVSENQKIQDGIKSEREYLRSQNLGLEQRLREIQDILKLKEDELKEIRNEYQNYKVRAQSVLRQNQTRDFGLEEKLSEEVASFKARGAILTSELGELKITMEKLMEENAKLKNEKEQTEIKLHQLENELEERRKQQELLSTQHQKAVSEHAEAIRGLKVHAETLAQCYRQQLSEQEVRHNREIIELQSKMEKVTPAASEVPSLSPLALPREQGEGSESVDTKHSLNVHPVPLDRLLSNESDQDVGFVKKQLVENEAKVSHLTALLADTEQDLAKHVQMNKLLKEEIRRQQRSVEREKHAENLEYLKNVVFKFATLSSGDERSHLVPVLNTILKFSPEETNKLNMVAKGELGSRSWSNYLPGWPSVGKPQ